MTFALQFFTIFIVRFRMNNKLFTTFYLQIDRQIEQLNQIIEQYFKYYINYNQNDQVKYLPMIQFICNISIYIFIKQISFFTTYRYYLELYKISIIEPDNLYITIKAEHLKFLYNRLKNELSFVRNRITNEIL